MIKLKCSFKETIKNSILKHKILQKYYINTFPNSKYSLDLIIEDILFILKSVLVGEIQDLLLIGNHYFGIFKDLLNLIFLNLYFTSYENYIPNEIQLKFIWWMNTTHQKCIIKQEKK